MKKKKKQGRKFFLNNSAPTLRGDETCDLEEASFMSDKSLCGILQRKEENSQKLIVCLPNSSDYNIDSRWIKSNWKNIVLLHPFLLRSFGIEEYVLVKGEEELALCVAYPYKSTRKNSVIFPKDNLGFKQGDAVTLHPYKGNVETAASLSVFFNEEFDVNPELTNYVCQLLSNRFLYVGLTHQFKIFDGTYLLTVAEISSSEKGLNRSAKNSTFEKKLDEICDMSNLTLEESELTDVSSSQKEDSSLQNAENEIISPLICKEKVHSISFDSSELIPKYYKLSFDTVLTIIETSAKSGQNIPLFYFSHIGGLNEQIQFIVSCMNMFLNTNGKDDSPFYGILMLKGPSGTGKTLVLNAVCNEYDVHTEKILWYNVFSKSQSEAEEDLKNAFQRAADRKRSIVVIDEFNFLCPKTTKNNFHLNIASLLSSLIGKLPENVLILAASDCSDYNDTLLKSSGRLLEEIKFQIPSATERVEILERILSSKNHTQTTIEIQECAQYSHGFTGKDLLEAINNAEMISSVKKHPNAFQENISTNNVIDCSDIKMALRLKKPNIVSADDLKVKKILWEDIGGMDSVKELLKQLVEWPLKYPETFKRFNITPSRGVLMYGPPGCSKTMIAKALATECELNFISKNASDLFHKYVGESEKAVRDMFALARAKAPCVIFLDEIDALVAERGSSGGSGVGDRIVTTLLTEIDGIEELHGVLVIAATNRPDMLDDALMRNGRINHFIYVPLPDAKTREEIFKIQMKKRTVSEDVDFKNLALKTEGYTGAEIVNICSEAAMQLLAEDAKAKSPVFHLYHFEKALESIQPRTSTEMIDFYENFNSKHCLR